ncbi:LysR family transcriptional regulator [Herbiconiux sp. CPCC 205716]|uniref:LysR family transcriptional regulator n=1 Tax=Herbiconiux gentiana TaxID=2970912 RepID=A0ABT2GJY1_9MICO|nr:LysR family transcriptional regulator [Herbiconiux gentiana]MCS5716468.1 LysR family transcriptional regulator [Herbiconiux gentiana]
MDDRSEEASLTSALQKSASADWNVLQFTHLETFLAVIEHKSFAAAAKSLFIAPSRVTERVQQLEAELNITLIDRSSRQLAATQAGLALIPRARAVIREFETIRTLFPEDSAPRLRVGMRSLPLELLEELKSALESAIGRRAIDTLPLDSATQTQLLLTGRLDFGFVWVQPPPPLRSLRVITESLAVVVPANRKFSALERVAPEDLAGLKLASTVDPLTVPADLGPYLDYLPRCDRVNSAVLGGTHLLVSSGEHCAFVPTNSNEHFLLSPETRRNILIKPLLEPAPVLTTYLAWHRETEGTAAFQPVVSAVTRIFDLRPLVVDTAIPTERSVFTNDS